MITPYQLEFHMLAADSGCIALALIDAFMNGLSEPVQDHLALFELPQDLQNIIVMSIRVDNFKRQRKSSIGLQFLLLVVGGTLWKSHLRTGRTRASPEKEMVPLTGRWLFLLRSAGPPTCHLSGEE